MKVALLVIPLLLANCADDGVHEKDDAELFDVSPDGKADGAGLLNAADRARLEAAFTDAIAAGEQTIAALEIEISHLEASHVAKQQEADHLVVQITAREEELRRQYNHNILLCALFPNPGTCLLANYLANDSALTQYKQLLAQARAQQAAIQTELASYAARRDAIRARITPVRAAKDRLLELLRGTTPAPVPPELAGEPELGGAYSRMTTMRSLSDSIGTEIALLVELRNAAVEAAQTLDQSLVTLRALDQSVEQLVLDARKQFMKLVASLVSGNPSATADKWLEAQISKRTRELLKPLGWPLSEFARFVVESRGGPGDPQVLVDRIMRKLLDDALAPPVIVAANTPVTILDNVGDAVSPLDVTGAADVSMIEIHVDIEHSYIGDLLITLEHAGREYSLSTHQGGSQDDLLTTYTLPDAEGVDANGRWTLHVRDTVSGDAGVLRRWELIAY